MHIDLIQVLKEAQQEAKCQEMEKFWLIDVLRKNNMWQELSEFDIFRGKLRREDVMIHE